MLRHFPTFKSWETSYTVLSVYIIEKKENMCMIKRTCLAFGLFGIMMGASYVSNVAHAAEWEKVSNVWFYKEDDTYIKNSIINPRDNDYYYLNECGAMVKNEWHLDEDDRWMYFGADGKAKVNNDSKVTVSDFVKINGKDYVFDEDGRMLYGWISKKSTDINEDDEDWKDSDFYLGEPNDGAVHYNWQKLAVMDDDEHELYWFYFGNNGKKEANCNKTINGREYKFAIDGHMFDNWILSTDSTIGTGANAERYAKNGAFAKNEWVYAAPDEDYLTVDYNNDTHSWWYLNNRGEFIKDTKKVIGGKKYLFDTKGRLCENLVFSVDGHYSDRMNDEDDYIDNITSEEVKAIDNAEVFYCGADGSMKYGYQNIKLNDDTYTFYFKKTGIGADGYIKNIKKYCKNGIVLKANGADGNYAGIMSDFTTLDYDLAVGEILINRTGSVQKNKKNFKVEDMYICTDKKGMITYLDTEKSTSK